MHAFIVRPFGTKSGIDFDRVERELIGPALERAGFSGGTTGELVAQGNIRTDMFEQLLIADFVIADISIHNANAFYELGIRHAFRDRCTLLIRCRGDDVPFDLKTDRYLAYDADDPAASLDDVVKAIRATWDSQEQDSPVFQLLPGLDRADPTKFLVVPTEFREEVEHAEARKNCGNLQLLSAELEGFAWKTVGLRIIGRAQFDLGDWQGAKATWKAVRAYDATDLEANTRLGTVYQRLGDLVKSDQALNRALTNPGVSSRHRAEIRALLGRNAKALWLEDWKPHEETAQRQEVALMSPHLQKSFERYRDGFIEDRNHFYSGLNALAMLTIMTGLAEALPEVWQEDFDDEEEALRELKRRQELHRDLIAGVKLALRSKRVALKREEETDIWSDISDADLLLLAGKKPKRVARAYMRALVNAPDFARNAVRNQLLIYQQLGIMAESAAAALESIPSVAPQEGQKAATPRVILFTGHRVDAPEREEPRFPPDKQDQARAMILEAVSAEKQRATVPLLGISGGASGGDILFHEVCEELEIPTRMYLVLPRNDYIKASVADAGPEWVERFKRLFESKQPEILSDSAELPRWLRQKPDYGVWQRSNLWMLHNALAISKDDLTLIALWNGEAGDGPGGTQDMVERAEDRGATFIHLDARKLVE